MQRLWRVVNNDKIVIGSTSPLVYFNNSTIRDIIKRLDKKNDWITLANCKPKVSGTDIFGGTTGEWESASSSCR
jgi:hypothetical protein